MQSRATASCYNIYVCVTELLYCHLQVGINNEVQGRTALHFAADYGQTGVISWLLDNGADINVREFYFIL